MYRAKLLLLQLKYIINEMIIVIYFAILTFTYTELLHHVLPNLNVSVLNMFTSFAVLLAKGADEFLSAGFC